MTTTPISTFTVPVTFRGVAYDVEITPLSSQGKAHQYVQSHIDLWNRAEKTHQLFSRQIVVMLVDAVPADSSSMLTAGSKNGFTFANPKENTQHKTSALWGEFISFLDNTESYIAGRTQVGDKEDAKGDASLSPEQQKTQYKVFKKKCKEHFYKLYGVVPIEPIKYKEAEKGYLIDLTQSKIIQRGMDSGKELKALWDTQIGAKKTKWAHKCKGINGKIAKAAAAIARAHAEAKQAAIAADNPDLEDLL